MIQTYYAHKKIINNNVIYQSLKDHLINTAKITEMYYSGIAPNWGYIVGLYHDIGKGTEEFQNRLINEEGVVDHSTIGAQYIYNLYNNHPEAGDLYALILASVIAGHHSGLLDYTSADNPSLEKRLRKEIKRVDLTKIIKEEKLDLRFPFEIKNNSDLYKIYIFTKMLYSALVDADSIETESFMNEDKAKIRNRKRNLDKLKEKFNKYIRKFTDKSGINYWRHKILNSCLKAANNSPGLYSLTAPTGIGKTISSMAFAINHACKHKKDRIIYVVPYTTIIEQNAEVFRKIFRRPNVIQHHSLYDVFEEKKLSDKTKTYLQLITENWDAPIIVTTNVQFFESFYHHKRSKLRKLHNITNSVIIFDEVQALPPAFLKPCAKVIEELVEQYKCTILLCTATQPIMDNKILGLKKVNEIVDNPKILFEKLNRIKVTNLGKIEDGELITRLEQHKQVMCIVHTRKLANQLYKQLQGKNIYHLSTLMCPKHRQEVLRRIRIALNMGRECKVITTQLVEAGVDIDFPVVYRIIDRLDSAVQAAGRCNRHSKLRYGEFFLFSLGKPPKSFSSAASISTNILKDEKELSIDTINEFFSKYFWVKSNRLDVKNILQDIYAGYKFPFETISHKMRLIGDSQKSVLIPYNETARKTIHKLSFAIKHELSLRKIFKVLQYFTVNIYEKEYNKLVEEGKIIVDEFAVLKDGVYKKDVGLDLYEENENICVI